MERKVIQQNLTTLVFSLPKKWTEKNGIKKGDRLLINEKANTLSISKKNDKKTIAVNIKDLSDPNKRIIRIILNDAYRKGYDEIIIYLNNKDKKVVKDLLVKENFLGFEILSEKNELLTLSSFTEPKDEQFESLFSKVILITYDSIKNINNADLDMIKTAEKYANFLRRQAIKEGRKNQYDNILRTIIIIIHSIKRMHENNLKIKDEKLLNEISLFFNSTFEKLFNEKIKFVEVQKMYESLEKSFYSKKIEKVHLHLFEILRNISLGSVYVLSLNYSLIKE